jgi:hypothetical protein
MNKSAVTLFGALLLLAAPTMVHAQSGQGDGYDYSINADNTLTVTNYTGPGGDVIIPNSINGRKVTGVAGAFVGNPSLTSVEISGSVTDVVYAFAHCTGLTNVTIPNGVLTIGSTAFAVCTSLSNIVIPDSVTSIGSAAFSVVPISSIQFPESVTNLDTEVFDDCTNLTNVIFGKGIQSVGPYIFQACPNLTSVFFQGNAPAIIGDGGHS